MCFLGGFRIMANKEDKTSGDAIYDDSPCLHHGCATCCVETEMPLTKSDIERIEKLGFKRSDFAVETTGEIRLRNRKYLCVFLEDCKCSIYLSRPEGCRIYPLVYDVDSRKVMYDQICPHHGEFKLKSDEKERLKRLIRRLDRETAGRG
jgi:uncharacterized protein